MINYLKRTWCEINLDNLDYNIKSIKSIAKKEIIAVVKADAYGHGDEHVCQLLESIDVNNFAVSSINEAISLRNNGVKGKILILGYTPTDLASKLVEFDITQTVYDFDYAIALNKKLMCENNLNKAVKVHIKIDTGMNRIGFHKEDLHDIIEICKFENIDVEGVFTHFSHADSFETSAVDYTINQMNNLNYIVDKLGENNIKLKYVHAQNSAGIVNYESDRYNYVRAGIIMYGLKPSEDVCGDLNLKPVMELKSIVTMVKKVSAGSMISYGRTFRATREIKIATVAIGYADGYYRAFSSKASVLIQGKRCKVVGRVCMDQMMVDVTGLDHVTIGEIVTLFGKDGDEFISVDELANIANTINYEIVCNMSRRVPRVYIKNKKQVDVADYLLGK